jgi:cytoskeletal protein RodZ
MPIILVIIGLVAALGLGGYFWNAHEVAERDITPVVDTTSPVTSTPTEPATTSTPEPVTTTPEPTPVSTNPTPTTPVVDTPVTAKTTYKNAAYSVDVTYNAPDGMNHPMTVKLTLKDDIVTASDVAFGSEAQGATANYQKNFAATYKTSVMGKSLDSIKLSRIGGASLTSNAWNKAKVEIATQAKS